jgi:hypothetical protein
MEAIHARSAHNGSVREPNHGDDGCNVGIGGNRATHGIPPPHGERGVQKERTDQEVPLPSHLGDSTSPGAIFQAIWTGPRRFVCRWVSESVAERVKKAKKTL